MYHCRICHASYKKWRGQCDSCGNWNSVESTSAPSTPSAIAIKSVTNSPVRIIPTGVREWDRVCGSGIVAGSVILLGGEPGIGKSTIMLQLALWLASTEKILIVTGEESVAQIHHRASRIGAVIDNVWILSQTRLSGILGEIRSLSPDLVIIDSIQTIADDTIPAGAGSVNQVRECAHQLIQLVKSAGITLILIGHVTKDGQLAGPKVLEHLVDVILTMESDRSHHYRLLRSTKNRYATTYEMGIFAMSETGLTPVDNPANLFLDPQDDGATGSVIVPVIDSGRAILVEIQALVGNSGYGNGKRSFVGLDPNRAHIIIAAMEKSLDIPLCQKDVFLNVVGGIKVVEPALDLGVALAIYSAYSRRSPVPQLVVMGEIGLTGEIRAVGHIDLRITESHSLGFKTALIPHRNQSTTPHPLTIFPLKNLAQAVDHAFIQ